MKKGFTASFRFKNKTIENVAILSKGFSLQEGVGEKGKHISQSCKISIDNREVLEELVAAADYVFASVYKAETVIFEGVIRPYVSIQAKYNYLDSFSIEILDYTELLKKYVYLDPKAFEGFDISIKEDIIVAQSWTNITVKDLITKLLALAKINELVSIDIVDNSASLSILKYFVLEEGDMLDEVVSKLLYENLLDFRFSPGKIEVFSTQISYTYAEEIKDLRLNLSLEKVSDDTDGIELKYNRFASDRVEIYRENNRFDGNWWEAFYTGQSKQGYYYQKDMHDNPPEKFTATWDFKQIKESWDSANPVAIRDLDVNATLHDEEGVTYYPICDSYDITGGRVYVYYDGYFDEIFGKGWGFEYSVTATVDFKTGSEIKRVWGLNPESYSAKYIDTADSAIRFVESFCKRQKTSIYKYRFKASDELLPGHFYSIADDKVTGLRSVIRITSRTPDFLTGLYDYKAEGADDVEIGDIVDQGTTSGSGAALPGESEILKLTANRSWFAQEEKDSIVIITAAGFVFNQDVSLRWRLNGVEVGDSGKVLQFLSKELALGVNTISADTYFQGKNYSASIEILAVKSSEDTIIQFKWGKSPVVPPIGGGVWFFSSRPIFKNSRITGDLESTAWMDQAPYKVDGFPYLWMRISHDEGKTWTYTCLRQPPTQSFSIKASAMTYAMSSREIVLADIAISFEVQKENITSDCVWAVEPKILEPEKLIGDKINITIPKGFKEKKITVYATVGVLPVKSIDINAVVSGEKKPQYLGIYPRIETIDGKEVKIDKPESTPIGPLMKGDYILYIDESADPISQVPYYFIPDENFGIWTEVSEDTENYSEIMSMILGDVLSSPATVPSTSAVFGYFNSLSAKVANIEKIFSQIIKLTGVIYGGGYKEDGTNPSNDPGFHLSALTGLFQAWGAFLKGEFECSDKDGIVLKTYYGEKGESFDSSPKSRWSSRDLCRVVSPGYSGSAIYNGSAYSCKRSNASNHYRVFSPGYLSNPMTYAYTMPFSGNILIHFEAGGGIFTNESYTVVINGMSNEYTSGTYNLKYSLKKGDTFKIIAGGLGTGVGRTCYLEFEDDALFLYNGVIPKFKFGNFTEAHSYSMNISGVFNSDNYKTLAPITGWASNLNPNTGYNFSPTTIYVDGKAYTPVSAIVSNSNIVLSTTQGVQLVFLTYVDNSEFSTSGWYDYSGALTLQVTLRGIATASLYPALLNAILGSPELPYSAGYIDSLNSKDIVCKTLLASALPTSSGGLKPGQIWNDRGTLKVV